MNRNADCQPVQTEQGFTGDEQNRHEKRNGLKHQGKISAE
jgi:hypothetical protein